MAEESTMELAAILYDNMGIVLQKFYESFDKVYDSWRVSEAISNGLLLINQGHLTYMCELAKDYAENSEKAQQELLEYIEWQNTANMEILRHYFPEPILKEVKDNEDSRG